MMRTAIPIILALLLLSACQPTQTLHLVASGNVKKLTQDQLILQDKYDVTFITLPAEYRQKLKQLKKGEHVTIWGESIFAAGSPETGDMPALHEFELKELVRDDGSRISLK